MASGQGGHGKATRKSGRITILILLKNEKRKTNMKINKDAWYIIRSDKAGVFFGHIAERDGSEVTMTDVRRIWYWDGAASLSQLATDGVSKPKNCKFTVTVSEMVILGVIEIIPCTEKAIASIQGVKEWRC